MSVVKCARRLFLLMIFVIGHLHVPAQSNSSREYQMKAAFLFNFAQFVEWPTTSFPSDNAPLVIGILGDDPFGTYLEKNIRGERVQGHQLKIVHFNDVSEVADCHILFINLKRSDSLTNALEKLKTKNILTVGESPGFIRQGGMIRFVTDENKIRLQINPDAAKRADITISARLLKLAEIIVTKQ